MIGAKANSKSVLQRIAMIAIGGALLVALLIPSPSSAETVKILAIGASNTNGKGVQRSAAWPARVEAMLQKKGIDAKVSVNAVNGSTTTQILGRLRSAIKAGPRVAIVAIPLTNDRRRKVNTQRNIAAMRTLLDKNGIKLVLVTHPHVWAEHQMQKDRIHFTVDGHNTFASKAVALVEMKLKEIN